MANILVLCTGNACRSQMAQTYLQHFLPSGNRVVSAGVEPKQVHPLTVQVMAEDGFDISRNTSNHIDELEGVPFAWILTASLTAEQNCPIWVRFGKVINHHFEDPSKLEASYEEQVAHFRKIRNEIKAFCKELANDPDQKSEMQPIESKMTYTPSFWQKTKRSVLGSKMLSFLNTAQSTLGTQ